MNSDNLLSKIKTFEYMNVLAYHEINFAFARGIFNDPNKTMLPKVIQNGGSMTHVFVAINSKIMFPHDWI